MKSLTNFSTRELIEEIEFRKYKKKYKSKKLKITDHSIYRFMESSGSLNKIKAYKTICRMFEKSTEIEIKEKEKLIRLLNNNCKPVKYRFYAGWVFVIEKNTLLTIYKNENDWFVFV